MVQRVKLHLAVGGLGVALVSLVEFQNAVGGEAVFSGNPENKRIDQLL